MIEKYVGAVGSNNLYGVYLDHEVPWDAAGLACWLRSSEGQSGLHHLARSYQGGSMKIEPRSLRDLLIPNDLQSDRAAGP